MFAVFIITAICSVSVFISYLAFRKGYTRSADDYFVAGSSLGYFVLIFSLLASFLSAFSMFGMSSLGYRTGFGALFVLTVNLVPLGYLWYYMHRKTFILGRARKWMSTGAPFSERYGNGMRVIIPLVVLLASIPYLVAQIQGIGVMIEALSDHTIPYHVGLFFVPFFIAMYLIMGGMERRCLGQHGPGRFLFHHGFRPLFCCDGQKRRVRPDVPESIQCPSGAFSTGMERGQNLESADGVRVCSGHVSWVCLFSPTIHACLFQPFGQRV